MPSNSEESMLSKTRHLGNDEIHVVWWQSYQAFFIVLKGRLHGRSCGTNIAANGDGDLKKKD
jgi:hypothetical protein